jgi:hypothetical protein
MGGYGMTPYGAKPSFETMFPYFGFSLLTAF